MHFPLRCLLAAVAFGVASPALAWFESLAALEATGARVTAVAVDLQSGQPVAGLNAGTRLSPASVTKLLVAAKAYDTWPAEHSFATRLATAAPPTQGVVRGDLLLTTEGDPSLDHESLLALAAQLKARGVERVEGNVVAVTAPFAAMACETKDRCDALSRSVTSYNAPLAGLGTDYGNWCIEVRGTRPGKPAEVTSCAGVPMPITVNGSITTAKRGRGSWWVDRRTVAGEDSLWLGGSVPAGEIQTEYRSMSEPARGAALLLRSTLRANGIAVQGSARVRNAAVPLAATAMELARVQSLPVREQVGRMLRHSNNFLADYLTLSMAARRGESIVTLADASQGLAQYTAQATADPGNPPLIYSGSGLTPENLISASEVAALLGMEYRNPARFSTYYGSLVVTRYAPYRFLRTGSENWLDRVVLKTGTMSEPRSVCALAGYLRKQDGGFMAFAILVNGGPTLRRVAHYKAMEAIRADVDALLAVY